MDESINDMLLDLKILSMVQPDGKLYLINGVLALEPVSIFQPIRRYWSNNNRQTVSLRLKQRIMELEMLLLDKQIKHDWILREIENLIEPVKTGIGNLQETYSTDSQIKATFALFVSRLSNIQKMFFQ
uniref:Uncharacterized protein n=1 Tax=Pyramimonas orientalis virus TaxID=455367 RepID=A0A7M3UPF4_POV01|nr:hypothetical protein HWQ62_00512 [Pyramimonas orientalis virus]